MNMDKNEFLSMFREDVEKDKDRIVNIIHDEMVDYCSDNDIPVSELSDEELSSAAEEFVEEGL